MPRQENLKTGSAWNISTIFAKNYGTIFSGALALAGGYRYLCDESMACGSLLGKRTTSDEILEGVQKGSCQPVLGNLG